MQCYNLMFIKDCVTPVPCGQCFACRCNRANEWARRIIHESVCHTYVTFLTLTYNEKYLPKNPRDKKKHISSIQLFLKRLRKVNPRPLRYFAVSQFGDKKGRLHYHFILFGVSMREKKKVWQSWAVMTDKKKKVYDSFGFIKLKVFDPKNAYYVARYVAGVYDCDTVSTMSRRPIIGYEVCKHQKLKLMSSLMFPRRKIHNVSRFRSYIKQYLKDWIFRSVWIKKVLNHFKSGSKAFLIDSVKAFRIAYVRAQRMFIKNPLIDIERLLSPPRFHIQLFPVGCIEPFGFRGRSKELKERRKRR